MSNNQRELENEVNHIVERMKDIEMKRDADIKAARFMTSLPNHTHSYGQFALCEKSEFSDFALDIKSYTAFALTASRMHHRYQC